jgi:hypothetical protein
MRPHVCLHLFQEERLIVHVLADLLASF